MANEEEQQSVPRDWRALIVAVTALGVILAGGIVAIVALPGPLTKDQVDNASQNIVAIASAGFTAVAAIVSAYFGIKAANLAREDSTKAAERTSIRASHLAGAEPGQSGAAEQAAVNAIKELDLV